MVADELEDAVYQFLCRIVAEIIGKIDSFRVSLMGLKLFSLKTPPRIPVSQTMPPFFTVRNVSRILLGPIRSCAYVSELFG